MSVTSLCWKCFVDKAPQDYCFRRFSQAHWTDLCRSTYLSTICLHPGLQNLDWDNVELVVAEAAGTPPDCWIQRRLTYYGSIGVSFYRSRPLMGLAGEVESFTGWIGTYASCLGSWSCSVLVGSPLTSNLERIHHPTGPSATTFSTDSASRNSDHLNSCSAFGWYYLLAFCWRLAASNLGTAEDSYSSCSSYHFSQNSSNPTQIGLQAFH